MKKHITTPILVMMLVVFIGSTFNNTANAQANVSPSITYQNFHDDLSPHGTWMQYPRPSFGVCPRVKTECRTLARTSFAERCAQNGL